MQRFIEKTVGARFVKSIGEVIIVEACDDNDTRFGCQRLNLRHTFKAIDTWHKHVEQNDIGRWIQGFGQILGILNAILSLGNILVIISQVFVIF